MTAITFDILARDQASKALRRVGDELETLNGRASKFGRRFVESLGLGFGAERLVEFGKSAVDAFTATQAAQARLADAFVKFPKLADTNVAAMRRLNDEIEHRTGFLARDLAAGEANLAQFSLTGAQLKQVTPLLVDYADKTGQAIPEAATLLGRALLGNQRALKSVGITMPAVTASAKELAKAHAGAESSTVALARAQDHLKIAEAEMAAKRKVTAVDELRYRDAQNAVRDAYGRNQVALAGLRAEQDRAAKSGGYFDQVVGALRGKVGGFADKESQTARGQLRKLSAEFDNVRVEVGAKLLPVVLSFGHFLTDTLIPDVKATASWLKRNEDVVGPLAKVIGGLTLAVTATHIATKIWVGVSQAATTWTKLLGGAAATTSPEVATQGAAAATAATGNEALAGSAVSATTAIEAEGNAAVVAKGKLAGFATVFAAFMNEGGVNKRYTDLANSLFGTKRPAATATAPVVDPTLFALLGVPGGRNDGTDLPAHGTANRVLATAPVAAASTVAKKTKDILAGLPQYAVGAGSGIATGIAKGIKSHQSTAVAAAKTLATSIQTQIAAIGSTLGTYTANIAGTITGNAGLLNTGNQTVEGLVRFEKHQLSIDQTFHAGLAKLVKLGYNPAYISELAQAGPQAAGNIVKQLATATVAERNELNRSVVAIGVSAQQTGELAARAFYGKQARQMDALEAQLKAVNANIKAVTTDLATLARTGHLQTKVAKK